MAPHSSTLAWKIPWMEEPGGLQSMGSLRVRDDSVTSLSLLTFMHWRRKWQPTPVFLPGESQGRGSLVGCRLWGRTESDTTEVTWQQQHGPQDQLMEEENTWAWFLEALARYVDHIEVWPWPLDSPTQGWCWKTAVKRCFPKWPELLTVHLVIHFGKKTGSRLCTVLKHS